MSDMTDTGDQIYDLQNEIERLRGDLEVMRLQRDATHVSRCPNCARLRAALLSIAANTCCSPCQEAALVAREALAATEQGESDER